MPFKRHITIVLLLSLTFLTAFSNQVPIMVKDVEVNVMKTAGILRYDIVLKKTKELKFDNSDDRDSPGHHLFHHGNGLNFAIRPNHSLASLMELEQRTKYIKMQLRGGGNSGSIETEGQATVHLEYAVKKGVDVEKVRKSALDSTLLVLRGNKVIAELPLNKNT
ncbi:hypothetical protein [Cohnella sp. AR92]|uniref:hypothetical protein n=1 Tax=Cohnella sp. AR92 TaxID=648716 RepID=UPI000F8CB305|nr:hypothetical protein [Cohnella sp. AR92]RUS47044.1 hypothetical protein ELR57_11630 [Cohnella sp. AR92]